MTAIELHVASMTPEQFAAYRKALASVNFEALDPAEQENYIAALRAVNARVSRELKEPLSITVREGTGLQLPLLIVGSVIATFLILRDR